MIEPHTINYVFENGKVDRPIISIQSYAGPLSVGTSINVRNFCSITNRVPEYDFYDEPYWVVDSIIEILDIEAQKKNRMLWPDRRRFEVTLVPRNLNE